MDMAFHLNRSTGALAKAIDRGTRGVNFIINQLTFTLFPTALELTLVFTLLGVKFGGQFVGVAAATLMAYVGYTVAVTRWRTQFRRDLNLIENKCSAHVFDSLINYDSVKYFNNEKVVLLLQFYFSPEFASRARTPPAALHLMTLSWRHRGTTAC